MKLSGILKTQLKKNEYNMCKEFLKVGDVEIEKQGFHSSKSPMNVGDVHIIDRITLCITQKKGSKYLISYKNEDLTLLCV